jgi:hypothetical protein
MAKIGDYPLTQKDFGAKVDGKMVIDGAMTAGSPALSSASAHFVSGDAGKLIAVKGAGASGFTLTSTILTYVNSTTVTLAANAVTTVSGSTVWYGTNDTSAIQAALNATLVNSLEFRFAPGTSCTNGSITYTASGNETIKVGGAGKGISRILNFAFTQSLSFVGNASSLNGGTRGTYSDFTIGRPNYDAFAGTIGAKSLYVSNAYDAVMSGIDEYGAIGFGLQFDLSTDVKASDCYVHNHFGGQSGSSGTDGIHFYRCTNASAMDNTVHDVGDDGISFGSYSNTNPSVGVKAEGNRCYNTGGAAIKMYGIVDRALIEGNWGRSNNSGGIQLSDDFYNFTNASGFGPSITNIKIGPNYFSDITTGTFNIGAVYLNNWAPASGQNAITSTWKNISIKGVDAVNVNCGVGQRAAGYTQMVASGLTIEDLTINGTTAGDGIALYQWGGTISVKKNTLRNLFGLGIHLDTAGSSTPYANATLAIEENTIDGYAQSGSANGYGIWLRPSDPSMRVIWRNNMALNQTPTSTGYAAAMLLGGSVHPGSVIEKNWSDGTGSLNFSAGLASGYQGEPSSSSAITTGTWYVGQRIWNPSVATNAGPFQICNVPGTFGTLTGITGTIASGSAVLALNSTTGVFNGCVITITGVFGPGPNGQFTVNSIVGNNAYLNGTANASVTNATVQFSTPKFIAAASAGSIYTGNLGSNVVINFNNLGGGNTNLAPGGGLATALGSSSAMWGTLYSQYGLTLGTKTVSAAYTATANDYKVNCNATTAAFAVTLETSPVTGQIHIFKKTDVSSNAVTVIGGTIDGASSYALTAQYQVVRLQYNGATWDVI